MARQQLYIVTGEEFRRVANQLREVDATLPTQFRKALRDAAKPMVDEAKRRVRAIPVAGTSGSTGLRRRVARGVRAQAAVGRNPRLRIVTRMASADEAIIPRGLDRREGWRHPVFGNRDVWVTQHTGGSWFLDAMQDGREPTERLLTDALEEARDRIVEAGG